MRFVGLTSAVVVMLLAALGTDVRAQDKLTLDQLPKPVQTAVKTKRDGSRKGKDREALPPTQIGRALQELEIPWIAAHSPQAKGRIERLFETLQDRLVKEMRLAGIDSIAAANHFLEMRFLPEWEERFTVAPRRPRNAHRRLDRDQRLEEILSMRVGRQVADDHTVSWDGNR